MHDQKGWGSDGRLVGARKPGRRARTLVCSPALVLRGAEDRRLLGGRRIRRIFCPDLAWSSFPHAALTGGRQQGLQGWWCAGLLLRSQRTLDAGAATTGWWAARLP